MFISPPAWVNSIIRLSVAAVQSRFSVPESMVILAPEETGIHSTGIFSGSIQSIFDSCK